MAPKARQESWKKSEDVALCIAVVSVAEDGAKIPTKRRKNCGSVYLRCMRSRSLSELLLDPLQVVKLVGKK
jgi:hypothetical protein